MRLQRFTDNHTLFMMRIAALLFLLNVHLTQAQLKADFDFPQQPYSVCQNESLSISNASTGATAFLWDFCPETFQETPSSINLATSPDLSGGTSYKLVNAGSEWFGFLVNRAANKILRFDFGSDPTSIPSVVDIGNPGGFLNSPDAIDIYHHAGEWHGFVSYNGDVVRLGFGESLNNNSPSATRLNLSGPKRFPDLKITEQDGQLIVLVVVFQDNAIRLLDFGSSFDNLPVVTEVTVSTVEFPLGISVVRAGSSWIIHLTSRIQNGTSKFSITQLNFGDNLFNVPVNEAAYNFPGLELPHRMRMHFSGGEYFGFVSNEFKRITIINFYDFNPVNTPEEISSASLPSAIGFDIIKHEGKSLLHTNDYGDKSLEIVSYERICDLNFSWSAEPEPYDIKFGSPGSYPIDLIAFSESFGMDETSQVLTVGMNTSPDISIVNDVVCVNTQVNFTVQTSVENLISWSWDFGNEGTSDVESPSATYPAVGVYPVKLQVNDDNGCSAKTTKQFEIFPSPESAFSLPVGLICTNNQFTFSALTEDVFAGNLSYKWYVDGRLESSERDLVHAFTSVGSKELRLITAIPGCSTEVTKTISMVEAGPVVDFSFTGICADELFEFQEEVAEPVESYLWDFGNGQSSMEPNPQFAFQTPGDFVVSLTATNSTGCENVKTRTISAQGSPVADFHLPGAPNACSGSPALFLNQTTQPDETPAITEWLWEFGDPLDNTIAADANAQHTFLEPGIYQVSLTATTSSGCDATLQKAVVIAPSPSTDFTFTPACDDEPMQFTGPVDEIAAWYWKVEGVYYTNASPAHTFRAPGDYSVYLEVTGTNNCSSEITQTVTVPIPLSPDFTVLKNCVEHEAIFTALTTDGDPIVLQEWDFSSGDHYTGSPVTHTFVEQGTEGISLKVTTAAGCSYQVNKVVNVLPSPAAAFSADPLDGAFPLEVNFTNNSTYATKYSWRFSDRPNETSTEISPVHTFTGAGAYEVILKAFNDQQCEDSTFVLITTVDPLPDVDIEMITVTPNTDGSSKMIITLHNKGNTVLKDLPIDIDFQGALVLRHTAHDRILPGSKYNVVFNTGILNVEDLRYVCASIEMEDDRSMAGNRLCKEFENSFLLFPGYPNPTKGILQVEWIAPMSSNVRMSLIDALGRRVLDSNSAGVPGFNQVTLDLSALRDGIYYLFVDDGTSRNTQRILLSSQW